MGMSATLASVLRIFFSNRLSGQCARRFVHRKLAMAQYAAGAASTLMHWVTVRKARSRLTSGLLVVALLSGSAQFAAQATSATAEVDAARSSGEGTMLAPVPTIGAATAGNGQLTIAFAVSPSAEGETILYGVLCNPGGVTAVGLMPPIVVTGLSNGISYSCTVYAINAAGPSAPSAAVVATPRPPLVTIFAGSTAGGQRTATLSLHGGGPNCQLKRVRFDTPAVEPPVGVTFPDGLVDFVTAGCARGSTLTFSLISSLPLPSDARYWRYGRTSADHSLHWYPAAALISGSTITYSITDGGVGDDDLAINGTIASVGGLGIGTIALPLVPDGLTATPGDGSVSLRWNATRAATGYTVKRASAKAGPYISISTKQSSNAYTDQGRANGTTYFYSVSATNSGGESADSTQVQATPLAPSQVAACGVEPMTVPRTVACPPEMAGAIVEQEVYVCNGTQWQSTGFRVKESMCTPLNLGSGPPTTF
jgi:hypothetical protein